MSTRKIDITVFGASGFTGEKVVKELVRQGFEGKIALAGRSTSKLEHVAGQYGLTNKAQIVVANVTDYPSLLDMAKQSRVVLACVGPYRLYGDPVVRACVEAGTDYLDVSGEPEFIERVEADYFEAARASGCYVLSAAGFDSIPADLGAAFAASQFRQPAVCQAVESFLTLHTGPAGFAGHYATYESAVLGFGAASSLRSLRKRLDKQPWRGSLKTTGPLLARYPRPVYEPRASCWVMPFPGSDASVVRRTTQLLAKEGARPAQYAAYFTLPSFRVALLFIFFGRSLLLRYPKLFSHGVFSHEGPSQQQLDGTSFSKVFIAHGYRKGPPKTYKDVPDMRVYFRVSGPEPGYVATPIVLVTAARTLLDNRASLGPGGVYTTGYLLRSTDLVDRLVGHGMRFEVLPGAEAAGLSAIAEDNYESLWVRPSPPSGYTPHGFGGTQAAQQAAEKEAGY